MNPDAHEIELQWANPFSAHRVRPGSLHYRFPDECSVEDLLERLSHHHWRGQIVGPHGTGKTTLLHTLDTYWPSLDRTAVQVSLRDRQRFLPRLDWKKFSDRTQVIVDGYEQLIWPERWRLAWLCQRRQCGLLVTTHRQLGGLPMIHQTRANVKLVQAIARDLIAEHQAGDTRGQLEAILRDDKFVESRFASAGGNVRETWMLLYDDAEKCFRGENEHL